MELERVSTQLQTLAGAVFDAPLGSTALSPRVLAGLERAMSEVDPPPRPEFVRAQAVDDCDANAFVRRELLDARRQLAELTEKAETILKTSRRA